MIKMPDTLEICARDMSGYPCCGAVYRRLAPNFPYCMKCGSKEPGVTYARLVPSAGVEHPCSGGWCGYDARSRPQSPHTPECVARRRSLPVYREGEPRDPVAAPCCGCTCQKCASGHDTGTEHTDACQELRNAGRKD